MQLVSRVSLFAIVLAAALLPHRVVAEDPAPPLSDDPAQAALDASDQARAALHRWRKAVEAGAPLRDEDLTRFRKQMQGFGGDLEWIFDRARNEHRAKQQAEPIARSVDEQVQTWVSAMRALGKGASEKRVAAVEELRAALASDDADRQHAALATFQKIGDVNFDKASFRPLVLPFVENAKGNALVDACYALYNTQRQPSDLALVERAWDRRSPALDNSMSHLLFMFSDGKIRGRSEEIVLELLASPHADVRREALRGLWGADVSDEVAERMVQLADDPESRHDAIYFGLSTLKPKNAAAVDKLIETLGDQDWNDWSRALWGLGYGVPRELQPRVTAALTEMYAARSDPKVRKTCRDLIQQYAGDDAVEKLPQ